jgi:CDP-diacylglycerol--serine O-phosphatidyltransferase
MPAIGTAGHGVGASATEPVIGSLSQAQILTRRSGAIAVGATRPYIQGMHNPEPAKQKPFSMIREFQLADWFTLGNALCGTGAIFSAISFVQTGLSIHLHFAAALILAALVFDVLDGRVARWRQQASSLGRELDSLADVISFGVAPAMLAYACGMQGFFDRIVLAYFVACGVSRLARFNVTAVSMADDSGKVSHFEGTPIPTSVVLVVMLQVAAWSGAIRQDLWFGETTIFGLTLHPLVLVFAVSGSLMISRIRIPKP